MSHDPIVVTVFEPQPISVVTQILRGSAGANGVDGGTFIKDSAIAAVNLSGHRMVCKNDDNQLIYANPHFDNYGVLGMTMGSASQNALGEYLISGAIEENSWSWVPGKPLFLQNNGQISQVPPSTGFLLQVGKALTPSKIFVQIQLLIKR